MSADRRLMAVKSVRCIPRPLHWLRSSIQLSVHQSGERNGHEDKEARQADPPLGRQSSDRPKADGDAPVQAYIAAMPGLEAPTSAAASTALIIRAVPACERSGQMELAVLLEMAGQGWFLASICTRYVKVSFFRGAFGGFRPAVSSKRSAVPRHPRGRPERRGEVRPARVKQGRRLPGRGVPGRLPTLRSARSARLKVAHCR